MVVYLSWGERLLRARSNWRHTVAVTLPIIGESNKIKIKLWWPKGGHGPIIEVATY